MQETTFVMIKPNVMKKQKSGAIIQRFEEEGLQLVGMKLLQISVKKCEEFYQEHSERPFFSELVKFISSHPVVVLALFGENAILKVREIIGDTNPEKATVGSLRAQYGDSIGENAVHGSDSPKSAKRELALFFSSKELFQTAK